MNQGFFPDIERYEYDFGTALTDYTGKNLTQLVEGDTVSYTYELLDYRGLDAIPTGKYFTATTVCLSLRPDVNYTSGEGKYNGPCSHIVYPAFTEIRKQRANLCLYFLGHAYGSPIGHGHFQIHPPEDGQVKFVAFWEEPNSQVAPGRDIPGLDFEPISCGHYCSPLCRFYPHLLHDSSHRRQFT